MIKKIITSKLYILAIIFISPLIVFYTWQFFFVEGSLAYMKYMKTCMFMFAYFLVALWQYLILLNYLKETANKALLVKINGLISILFLLYYFHVQISGLISLEVQPTEVTGQISGPQPIKVATLSVIGYIYVLFFLHGNFTFIFNTIFISVTFRKHKDKYLYEDIRMKYVKPSLIVTILIIGVSITFLIITFIIDIINLWY